MAKVSRVRRLKYRCRSGKAERVRISSCSHKIFKDIKKPSKLSEKKDWEDTTSSVCMESPTMKLGEVMSTFTPGTIILMDYAIDRNFNPWRNFDMDMDDLLDNDDDLEPAMFGANEIRSGGFQLHRASGRNYDSYDDEYAYQFVGN